MGERMRDRASPTDDIFYGPSSARLYRHSIRALRVSGSLERRDLSLHANVQRRTATSVNKLIKIQFVERSLRQRSSIEASDKFSPGVAEPFSNEVGGGSGEEIK